MLDLTSKNYDEIIIMRISWLQNLFNDLMTNYTWFNYVLSKMTKLRKLKTRATGHKTKMQRVDEDPEQYSHTN